MDRNTIKDTGVLEQYLLGELSEKDSREVAQILKEDSELQAYFRKMEDDMEQMAFENAISPPTHIKSNLLNSIKNSDTVSEEGVIPIQQKKKISYRFAIAASLAALFLCTSGWLYNQWKNTEATIVTLQKETTNLQDRLVTVEDNLKETDKWYRAINNPKVVQLVLKGNEKSPTSSAVAYVNHQNKEVILNPQGLSKLDNSKTYQMWADVDGEMIDMGVIAQDQEMITMKYIENAASLNITIEPAGGNDHPTVEQLISNVYL
ncbi:anti-sigma factor [uncultured Aquimarina sp.]|uniref:anti-sigma factor n=1 Tax=uncultured Aquimarina sp. TaxID=575652 RepID=UPI00260C04BF|nr:anti-sigma factor [uncultured Aquimarina sp.]